MRQPGASTEPAASTEPLAKIEAMILELDELRAREREATIVSAHRAAIERLHGLHYRLQTRVYGLPGKTAASAEESREAPVATKNLIRCWRRHSDGVTLMVG